MESPQNNGLPVTRPRGDAPAGCLVAQNSGHPGHFARNAISRARPSSQDTQQALRRRSAGPGSVREKARRQMSAGQFFEFDLWLVLPVRPEPGEKMGLGSSPRSLSPNTGIWRPASPVECRWLSVSRRYAGLHERLQSISAPQRSRPAMFPPPTFG